MRIFAILILIVAQHTGICQYAPGVGVLGTNAVSAMDASIKSWATNCTVIRGPKNISDISQGTEQYGTDSDGTGKCDSIVVSLGDGGIATLQFQDFISNGSGFDFVVFENSFNGQFLELAFVEVSSDGVNFHRFPCSSLTQSSSQVGSFGLLQPEQINNLAGKYQLGYGTPFDLEELKEKQGLDVNRITHVRIVDVVGCIDSQYATFDSNGNIINDPWPTAFAGGGGGFDLDAIGVLNSTSSIDDFNEANDEFVLYPDPGMGMININCREQSNITISDANGKILHAFKATGHTEISNLKPGYYFAIISNLKYTICKRFIVLND